MRVHIVKQGEFLAGIAWGYRVSEDAIWRDPANAALVAQRPSPNVLNPGDVLYVPDAAPARFKLKVGACNAFEAQVPMTTLKLRFSGDPAWAGAAYRVEGVYGMTIEGCAGGDGAVEVEVPANCGSVELVFPDIERRFRVDVGHLDPVSEPSGVRARLQHLGFLRPVAPGEGDAMDRAVKEFQSEQGLEPTGEIDEATASKLSEAYGS